MLCRPRSPLRMMSSTRVLKLSMPGWMTRTPASRSNLTCAFLRLAFTS